MKKITLLNVAALLIWLLPLVYLFTVYAKLPESVPVHYGINGKADRLGDKSEFSTIILIISLVSGGTYLLLNYLPSIDPKKQVKAGEQTYAKLAFGLVVFLSALNLAIVYGTVNKSFQADKVILPIIGLLFVFFGNMMYSIKPNYFAGVRTPWTLESEDNWRATHRLAGKLWVVGGIIITALVLLLPSTMATMVFIPAVLILSFIPIGYSYIYFKKHQPR